MEKLPGASAQGATLEETRENLKPGAGLRSGLIAEQADAGPRAGALLALRIGQEREKAQPKSEALQSRGSL